MLWNCVRYCCYVLVGFHLGQSCEEKFSLYVKNINIFCDQALCFYPKHACWILEETVQCLSTQWFGKCPWTKHPSMCSCESHYRRGQGWSMCTASPETWKFVGRTQQQTHWNSSGEGSNSSAISGQDQVYWVWPWEDKEGNYPSYLLISSVDFIFDELNHLFVSRYYTQQCWSSFRLVSYWKICRSPQFRQVNWLAGQTFCCFDH